MQKTCQLFNLFINGSFEASTDNAGTITIAADSKVYFDAGAGAEHSMDSTQGSQKSVITGAGSAQFVIGSKILLKGTVQITNAEDSSAVIEGTGNLVINGKYSWEGSKWAGTGTVQVGTPEAAGATLTISGILGVTRSLERPLLNYGTVIWKEGDLAVKKGGSIENAVGALFDIQADAKLTAGAGAGLFTNAGTLRKSAGKGQTVFDVTVAPLSSGQIQERSGKLRLRRRIAMQGGQITVGQGTTLAFDGGFDQSGGTTTVTDGTLSVTGSINETGGQLSLSAGNVAVTGDLFAGPAATISITDTTPSQTNDQITATAFSKLGGALLVSIPGYTPHTGDAFQVLSLSGGYSGTFASVPDLISGSGLGFAPTYHSTDVTLEETTESTSLPTVISMSANSGSTAGGTVDTITGTNFLDTTAVSFGGAPALSFTVTDSTHLTAVAPPHAAGTFDITVTNSAGTSATGSADQFTYTASAAPSVSGLTPASDYTPGGQAITINGSGFTGASGVSFGTLAASFFRVLSDTQILAFDPASSTTGTVDVTVTTASGTSATSANDHFTYNAIPVPTVTGVSPTLGGTGGGTSITITGTGFTNANTVAFGNTLAANFTIISDTQITVTDPPEGAGTVDVIVGSATGTSALNSGDRYSYVVSAAPTVSSLGTTTGTTAGGTSVIVTGSGFTGAGNVTFGGTDASSFVVNSDTQITAVAPPQAAGIVDVVVSTPSGTSPISSSDQFTVTNAAAPTVTSLPLNTGTTAGGTTVTILGTGFTGTTAVNFGSIPATAFTVLNDGTLTATAPAQAAGIVDVTVTTYGGTSATSFADQFTYTNAPAPAVSGLSATSGPTTGGTAVVLTGSNFTGATAVNFGSVSADFTVLSDNSIEAFAPAQAAGAVNVTVSTYSGTSSPVSYTYTAAPLPAITGLSTSSGSSAGGTLVEINGSGFTNASEVDFGAAAVYDFTVNSDGQITVVAPPNYAGTVDVSVITAAGTSASVAADRFTYTAAAAPAVTGLSISSGSTAGGTTLTLTGSGFTGASDVLFGGVSATSFTVNSDSSISAMAPPNAAGIVDVTVATPSGTSAVSASDRFTYNSAGAPAVSALATSAGTTAGGATVGISGYGFTGATAVNFGNIAADFTVVSDTLITATAPPQAAGTVHVSVTTFGGTSSSGSADQFTYSNAAAPAITGLTPASGTTAGGTAVTILGSGFTGATGVSFGNLAAADFTVNSDTSITATSPMTAAGMADVRVTTFSGTSPVVTADQFTTTNLSAPAPAITAVSPNTGSSSGGQVVSITGTNFTGTSGVSFGGTAATSFTILSDTALTATAPAGTVGTVDVRVTTNNGTSTTGSADQFTYLATPAPSIVSLSPSSGTSAGGASVTITGTNFTGATSVLFGTTPATNFSVTLPTTITATAPPLPAGSYAVTVTTPSGTSASSTFTVTAAAVPTLTNLGTSTGTTAGGTSVSITGSGFTGATAVSFGGVAASSFTVNSDTSITATAPPQNAGTVDVSVSTYAGTTALSAADRFTYTLAALPAVSGLGTTTGTTAGGTAVTINGSGFTGATTVSFGKVAASSFTVVSDTQITATAPAQAAGLVDVQVTTYAGSSAAGAADHFTYTNAAAPAVTSLGTTTGTTAGGTAVTVNGSGFTGATAVSFGSMAAASFSVLSDTQISAVSPAQAAGNVNVSVTTFSGTSPSGSGNQFSYTNAATPAVTGVSANSGSAAGGATVTISGSGFTGATAVSFGTTAATDFTVVSDGVVLATAPAGSAGTVDVTVSTYSGTSTPGAADHYTYTAVTAPAITSLNPSTAGTGGGTVVTLSGSGFLNATGVAFGSTPAVSFTIVSDSSISAVVPPLPAGTVDVTVTAFGTTSALVGADRFTSSAANAPVVSGLGTTTGTTAGGTSVTISGSGFTGAGSVTFGGVAATGFTVNSDTSLTAVSPSQAAGTVDVIVSTPTGTSATGTADHFTYTNAAAPAVTGLSLTGGSSSGGTVVTVSGSGFTGATGVNFGSIAAGFTVNNDGILVATAPAQAAGTVDVTVVTPSGTSATGPADHFTYTAAAAPAVTAVTPNSGSSSGGSTVTLLGSGFTGATAVNFGTTAAAGFTVLADGALTATAPAGSAGTVDITVVSSSGTSATGVADQYSYTAAALPVVGGLGPTSGSANGGTTVVVRGTGFTGASAVNFGGYAANFVVNSDAMLTAIAPAQAAAVVDVTVATPAGTSSTSPSDRFTYTSAAAPAVTGISPNAGPNGGGTEVTVSGSGFTGTTAVYFGSTAALDFSVSSDNTLFAESPAESAGTVDVTVVTPSGTSSTGTADRYTFQSDAPLTAVAGSTISATAGWPFNKPVASFTDTDTSGTASQFSAYIDWGNGQHTTGQVVANGFNGSGQPQFVVTGSNTYASVGSYTIAVSIQDVGGASGQASSTATVTSPPQAPSRSGPAASGTTATATHGVAFKGGVASFTGLPAGSYSTTIDWGNGQTTAGTLVATSPTTFSVVGSNTYTTPGVYTLRITISLSGGGSTTVETTITVADATDPADDGPRAAAVSVALLARPEAAEEEDPWDAAGGLSESWGEVDEEALDVGRRSAEELDACCVDALFAAVTEESAAEAPPPAVLDEVFSV